MGHNEHFPIHNVVLRCRTANGLIGLISIKPGEDSLQYRKAAFHLRVENRHIEMEVDQVSFAENVGQLGQQASQLFCCGIFQKSAGNFGKVAQDGIDSLKRLFVH